MCDTAAHDAPLPAWLLQQASAADQSVLAWFAGLAEVHLAGVASGYTVAAYSPCLSALPPLSEHCMQVKSEHFDKLPRANTWSV